MPQGSRRKVAQYRTVNGLDLLSAQVGVPYLPLLPSQRSAPIDSEPERAMAAVAVTMLSFFDAIIEPRVLTAPTRKHAKQASKQIARAMASPELVAMTGLQLTHSVVRWRCELADHISGNEPEIEQIRSKGVCWRQLRTCLQAELPLTATGIELLDLAARHYRFLDGDFALKQDWDMSVYLSAAEDGDQQAMDDAREWQEGIAQRCLMWDSITDAAGIVGPDDLPLLEGAHATTTDTDRYVMLLSNHALVYSNTAQAIARAVGT
jgi:hypothetical protein